MNKLENNLITFLGEDCANMNPVGEIGFFTCAGSMFATLENAGLTTMSGYDFVEVRFKSKQKRQSDVRQGKSQCKCNWASNDIELIEKQCPKCGGSFSEPIVRKVSGSDPKT